MNTPEHAAMRAAVDRLAAARDRRQALAPLRNLLADADEDTRAAAAAAAEAGLSERGIAARLNVAQPTIHAWLDGRATTPIPGPTTATTAWSLHYIVSAAASEVARLRSNRLPSAPTPNHTSPRENLGRLQKMLSDAAHILSGIAAALDYSNDRASQTPPADQSSS